MTIEKFVRKIKETFSGICKGFIKLKPSGTIKTGQSLMCFITLIVLLPKKISFDVSKKIFGEQRKKGNSKKRRLLCQLRQ